jgi:Chorismate mutase
MKKTIPELRQEIDQIHKELFALLVRRREVTMQIWKIKKEKGEPFFDASREKLILQDFVKLNAGSDPEFDQLLEGVMNSVLREFEKYLKAQFDK